MPITSAIHWRDLRKKSKVLWFEFIGPGKEPWKVYFSIAKKHPTYFVKGKDSAGTAWFGGRFHHTIFINADQKWPDIIETLIHELSHLAYRYLHLSEAIDESVVDETSRVLASILIQSVPEWPPCEGL